MGLTICDMSVSLDGYVTGPHDSRENPFGDGAENLHAWLRPPASDDDRAVLESAVRHGHRARTRRRAHHRDGDAPEVPRTSMTGRVGGAGARGPAPEPVAGPARENSSRCRSEAVA